MTSHPNLRCLLLFALVACAGLPGCIEEDPNSPAAQARQRGRDWAFMEDVKRVTDCGALEDMDERDGCARYVHEQEDLR
ncbi:MAG: hypothetical protein ACREO3_02235, partial [Arenimonas sp.]